MKAEPSSLFRRKGDCLRLMMLQGRGKLDHSGGLMGVMVNNEGKACDAVVRVIEQYRCEVRADVRRPENDLVGPRWIFA